MNLKTHLYRTLKPSESLFSITNVGHIDRKLSQSPTLTDDDIEKITITREINTPSTCEYETSKYGYAPRPGSLFAVTYSAPPLLKSTWYSPNQNRRFTGMVVTSEKTVLKILGGQEHATVNTAAAGFSRYLATARTVNPGTSPNFAQAWISHLSPITGSPHYYYGELAEGAYWPNPENKSITASNLTSAIKAAGFHIIEKRDGALIAQDYGRPLRELGESMPRVVIDTHQVTSAVKAKISGEFKNYTILPAFFAQQNLEQPVKLIHLWQKLISGGHITAGSQILEWQTIEEAIYPTSSEGSYPERLTLTHLLREYGAYPRLQSVTVNLLLLAQQPFDDKETNIEGLRLINALLAAEVGELILLGDSFGAYTGKYQIVGMKESVSPDNWEIEIEIDPEALLTGKPDSLRTWDKAPFPWDSPEMTDWTS